MSAATTCPAGTGPIPQIIHQSWRTHELPSTLRPLSASWSHLSGWRHRLWTDDENRALWAAHFPELLDVYDGYARPVQRADATRLLYMHVHGGVYADLDVAPCHGLPSIVLNGSLELLLVREPSKSPRGDARRYLTNFWMASAPGHPFWRHAIALLRGRAKHADVMSATGPYFLNAAWMQYQKALRAAPAACAARAAARARILTFREWQRGVGAHHWASTWHYGEATSDPTFQAWLGVDLANNCAEGAFREVISTEWECRKHRYRCPRRTWAVFEAECNLTKRGCPEAREREARRWAGQKKRRAEQANTQEKKRALSIPLPPETPAARPRRRRAGRAAR